MPSDRKSRRFTPARTGDASPLGQLERAVMTIVWASPADAVSVGEVHAALPPRPNGVAYTTVKTTMERLTDKGILVQKREGRAYLYRAALSREELERRIVCATLDRLVEQFPQAVASFFLRPDPQMTDERLDLLREAIEQQREQYQVHREDTPDA